MILKPIRESLGVVVIGITLITAGATFMIFINDYVKKEDLVKLDSEVQVVRLQVEDTLDARIQYVVREITKIEAKIGQDKATEVERINLNDLKREHERLRQLRYKRPGTE